MHTILSRLWLSWFFVGRVVPLRWSPSGTPQEDIDAHDVVIRFNGAPTAGYGSQVEYRQDCEKLCSCDCELIGSPNMLREIAPRVDSG